MNYIRKTILGTEVIVFWNHRIMSRVDGPGTTYEETNLYVVEVYYHDNGNVIGWTEKEEVRGSDLEEIRSTLTWMLEALDKPILSESELLAMAEAARERGDENPFPDILPVDDRLSLDEVLDSLGLDRSDVEEEL